MLNDEILRSELNYVVFHVTATNLISAFLSGSSQRVVCSGNMSSILTVSQGVPQGSILGPLLYTIYTLRYSTLLYSTTASMVELKWQIVSDNTPEIPEKIPGIRAKLRDSEGKFGTPGKTPVYAPKFTMGHSEKCWNGTKFEVKCKS